MSILDSIYAEVDGYPINLNQSRVQTYKRCHRKYAWFYHAQMTPDRPTYHLSLGTAVHHALANVKAGLIQEKDAVQYALDRFRKDMPKEKMPGDDLIIAENEEIIVKMLPAYYNAYKNEVQPWKPLGVEVAGRVEVGTNTNVFLVFRTDELALEGRLLWIVDHKTAKKLDPRDLLKYEMDLQISAYCYAITKKLDRRVAGVIVNLLVKTSVPQFHRERFTRDDDELLEFEQEFVEVAREIKIRHQRVAQGEDWKTVFYKTESECFSYGTCYFRDLCLKDTPTKRMAFKKRDADYVDNPALLEKKETVK